MVAYGASRYALARGDKAEELWGLIEWCLEYCKRKLNKEGVVTSDADELENRFPAGKANLCTSSLYYDALCSAGYLGKELGKPASQLAKYKKEAATLRLNIDKYFGAKVEGFNTYRYYEGNDVLRSWICIPLTVGIYERKNATIEALFSPRLWTKDGLLTQAGSETYWDRSTLYALRGVFACGETEKATSYLKYYSTLRLLGEHVPYAIEAWPEGNQRHLSAESGLYCRIITEGMFGIRPTGLHSFTVQPRLPKDWNEMSLRKIQAFDNTFDIEVHRSGSKIEVKVTSADKTVLKRKIGEGEQITVNLPKR
jgi:Cellobiose phosphorylase